MCREIDTIDDKAVLIPSTNVNELILSGEVEEDIKNRKFHIYTMENLDDAIEVLILNKGESVKGFFKEIEDELSKYKSNKKKK